MSISEPFIRRPVATTLLTISVALLGIVAYFNIPIASLPNIERPTIRVVASLPGGSADTVSSSLTTPLERQLGLISGLKEMHASSIYGRSVITLEFELDKDIDAAAVAVQSAINTASTDLPKDMPGPPLYIKANPNAFPIVALALTSDTLTPADIYQYADTVLAGKLSQIQGVAKVAISGATRPGVRIQVNPRALADMHMSTAAVKSAVLVASANLPKGEISDGPHSVALAANDQLMTAADYKNVVVAWKNGAAIKLPDVANVFDSTINDDRAGWFDDDSAVVLYVLKDADANVVQTVDTTLKMLPQLERWIPAGIHVHLLYDRTLLIRAAVSDVQFTMAIAILLVVLVVFLFLRRFWTTVIPTVTIPVSLAVTMAVIYALGFSLDNVSLLAVTIAVGFVIDDSVIIIENIARLVGEGEDPIDAALKGTRQMGFTVISIAVALVAALIPILFMPDIVGRLFREFGLTLVAAIVASAVVSLTLTPTMCAHLLRRDEMRPDGRFGVFCERVLDRSIALYGGSLNWALRHRWLTLTLAASLTAASVGMYIHLPKGFLPTQDTGVLAVRTISRSNISFEAKEKSQQAIADAITSDPAVANVGSYIGLGTMSGGSMLVSLKPPGVRKESVEQVIDRFRSKLAKSKDAKAVFVPLQDLKVGAKKSSSRYQYAMSGFNRDEVAHWALLMKQRLSALPQVTDVHLNYERRGLGVNVLVNRIRAARAGATPTDVDDILYDWFGQIRLDLIRYPINHARVVLEVEPQVPAGPFGYRPSVSDSGPARGYPEPAPAYAHVDVDSSRERNSVVHPFVQHAARRFDRRRHRGGPGRRGGRPCPEQHLYGLSRRSAAGRRNLAITAAAVPGGGHQHLYHPGHPLRELRSSVHHPVDASLGGVWGAARPRDHPYRVHAHRRGRLPPGDRHCDEKRDHDGGFRAGCGAAGGPAAGGGYPARGAAAFSPHHHDDNGRPARRVAAGAGDRTGLRTAPAARRCDRRRIIALSIRHALHHAGGVSGGRQAGPATPDAQPSVARSSAGVKRSPASMPREGRLRRRARRLRSMRAGENSENDRRRDHHRRGAGDSDRPQHVAGVLLHGARGDLLSLRRTRAHVHPALRLSRAPLLPRSRAALRQIVSVLVVLRWRHGAVPIFRSRAQKTRQNLPTRPRKHKARGKRGAASRWRQSARFRRAARSGPRTYHWNSAPRDGWAP